MMHYRAHVENLYLYENAEPATFSSGIKTSPTCNCHGNFYLWLNNRNQKVSMDFNNDFL